MEKSFNTTNTAETQTLAFLQDEEHPQQERRQLLPEQQREQDGAPLGCEQQHGPSLQHRDGPAAHHQPAHPSGPARHPLRPTANVALAGAQPAAGGLGGTLLHGAHLQEAHVLRRLQPHDRTTAKHVVFLAGNTAKHGLRCKACKMSLHHKCENGVGQQRCMGKLPKGFRRYYSSPLLNQEQYGCIKEVMPIACGNKVDPVYEALRFGTSLAQKAKRASGSDSPHRNSASDLDNVPEEVVAHNSRQELSRKHSDDVFTVMQNGAECLYLPERKADDLPMDQIQLQNDPLKLNMLVALYDFSTQESHDLEMRAGDRILLADDSNDDWWKGVIKDRIGYFPAAFAHELQEGDQVFRCNRTFIGCKEQGQLTLKEGQICVSSEGERGGFIRVAFGKKRGYVPCDILEII
ncbi:SH3 and cysteine-rich domain-containing protein isoform X5 [Xiphophorus couchianus]|uniref:SH3 and cysteine-rich domain-containing protein isoform X5 n=1 Tax=Xiphophorus couchianus TaxID=32473 RepID=UPI0010164C42|nr:SH3 and cysteine-rich domain-containing protein isoform X5 [Xiphophorus couchianus]